MKIPSEYVIYVLAALGIGLILSFGIVGMMPHQAPMQVQLTQYQPLPPPTAAIPIQTPQLVPGSAADLKKADPNDKFAPAPAPVVVTTQPLPTITPQPTQAPAAVSKCDVNAAGGKGVLYCQKQELVETVGSAMSIAGIAVLVVGPVAIMMRLVGLSRPNGGGGGISTLMISGMIAIVVGSILMLGMIILDSMLTALSSGMLMPP
jgi:hypothetical protein